MFNIGGGELLVILVLALVVLGPDKLPEAAREFGRLTGQLREMARGFQREFDSVKNDLTETEARARGAAAAAANPGPRGNQDTFAASDAPTGSEETSSADSLSPSADSSSPAEGESAEQGPAPMADPFVGLSGPSFDANVEPDRTVKPRTDVPGVGTAAVETPEETNVAPEGL